VSVILRQFVNLRFELSHCRSELRFFVRLATIFWQSNSLPNRSSKTVIFSEIPLNMRSPNPSILRIMNLKSIFMSFLRMDSLYRHWFKVVLWLKVVALFPVRSSTAHDFILDIDDSLCHPRLWLFPVTLLELVFLLPLSRHKMSARFSKRRMYCHRTSERTTRVLGRICSKRLQQRFWKGGVLGAILCPAHHPAKLDPGWVRGRLFSIKGRP
jgi:hypothetical protein